MAAATRSCCYSPQSKHALAWSPDGRFLAFATLDAKTRFDLWLLPMTGDRTPHPLVSTDASEQHVQISPDGRWFVYTSNQSGRFEVYVQRSPPPRALADFNHWRRRCQMER